MANRFISYFIEARQELRKVVWPTAQETRQNTLIVIGLSIFVAIFLGLIDLGLTWVMNQTLNQ